jgi:hypothetical protein
LDSWPLKMVLDRLSRSVYKNYHYSLCNIQEERSSDLIRGVSIKSRMWSVHQYVTQAASYESGDFWPMIPLQRAAPSIIVLLRVFSLCQCLLCPCDLCVLQLPINIFVMFTAIVFTMPKYLSQ